MKIKLLSTIFGSLCMLTGFSVGYELHISITLTLLILTLVFHPARIVSNKFVKVSGDEQ